MHNQTRPRRRLRYVHSRALLIAIALPLTLLTGARQVRAQTPVTADPRDTTHAQTQAPFFTKKDFVLAGAFAAGTVLMFPLDEHIATHIREGSGGSNFLKHTSTNVEVITSPGAFYIGAGLYLAGRVGGWERIADLGWHGTEAVLLAEGTTYVLKGIAGRSRPFISNGTDADYFAFGRGFKSGNSSSFPSGHTTTAFAAAAAVTNETTRWWPRSTWVVGPLMYAGATAVGLSRMYHNRHWASDVVLGAAIGTFSGRKVVEYAHGHPGNMLDRIMLHTTVAPDGQGGATIQPPATSVAQ
jgi:membrane-associated phospholipid phosphatase